MDIMTKKIRLIDSVIKIMNDTEDELACHIEGKQIIYERLLNAYQNATLNLIEDILEGRFIQNTSEEDF